MSAIRAPRCIVALTAALLLVAALAQDGAVPPAPVADDWRVVADPAAGFALRLPPDHDLAPRDGIWYVHGWHGDEPLLPDASVTFLPGLAPEEVVARDFPADADAVPLALGPATHGLRVTARYEAPDGSSYEVASYLARAPDGTYRIARYEGFAWPPFAAVARSFHVIEVVEGARAE